MRESGHGETNPWVVMYCVVWVPFRSSMNLRGGKSSEYTERSHIKTRIYLLRHPDCPGPSSMYLNLNIEAKTAGTVYIASKSQTIRSKDCNANTYSFEKFRGQESTHNDMIVSSRNNERLLLDGLPIRRNTG